ncbi:MAG: fluoride efflux transporter CrcB [Nibricoccus sp.]
MSSLFIYLWVAIGGALGSVTRLGAVELGARLWGHDFPWGTLLVNVVGAFVIGFFATVTDADAGGRWPVGLAGRQFFMTGVLGGFTTFSAFSLQTLSLARHGEWTKAGGYVAGSVVLCLVFVWLGQLTALAISPGRVR